MITIYFSCIVQYPLNFGSMISLAVCCQVYSSFGGSYEMLVNSHRLLQQYMDLYQQAMFCSTFLLNFDCINSPVIPNQLQTYRNVMQMPMQM